MMKYKYYLSLFNRKRKLCKFVIKIVTSLIILIMLASILFLNVHKKNIELKKQNIDHNYIFVYFNDEYNSVNSYIQNIEHIIQSFPMISFNHNENIFINYNRNLIKLDLGRDIKSDNEIIVPNSYDKKIGELLILFDDNNKKYVLKIVGIYNFNESLLSINHNIKNPIIVTINFAKKFYSNNNLHGMLLEVDKIENVRYVIDALKERGGFDIYNKDNNMEIINRYDLYQNVLFIFFIIVIIVSSIFLIICSFIIINDTSKDIFILRCFGYNNKKIFFMLNIYTLELIGISSIISIISLFPIIILVLHGFYFFYLLLSLIIYEALFWAIISIVMYVYLLLKNKERLITNIKSL